ncbi:hypothetical protein BDV23DRAFT_96066 [Aspergillus alliaceus]|uniref:Uncharacterized protein n=1 Tax=Petromyces alliaceus TaxID=209559 RepID=A0A5N6G2Q6_PETAA|nr:uncharacterized protein BDW43DRAFT_267264 [Aspergillus alliaceus]KAB8236611.1 hypothetical protein BDW43DRAFT_267264 [Aspergillus alliaceus]KAE8395544.1 hypothetical protein BDV23DRAFT_96066 [Aspergillus alliaceus]
MRWQVTTGMPLLMPASTFGSLLPMPAAPSVTVAEGVLMMTTFGNHVLAFAPTFSTLQDATPAPSRANCYALAQADLTSEDLTSVTMYRTNRILRTFHFAPLPPEADVACGSRIPFPFHCSSADKSTLYC